MPVNYKADFKYLRCKDSQISSALLNVFSIAYCGLSFKQISSPKKDWDGLAQWKNWMRKITGAVSSGTGTLINALWLNILVYSDLGLA